jgi:hypothetical protein
MGNATNTSQGKASTSNSNTGQPAWATMGSDSYNAMNDMMATGPMAAFNQTLAQGGQGTAAQNAIGQMQGMGGSNPWMQSAANSLQNVGQITPGQITSPGQITPGSIAPGQINLPGQIGTGNFQDIYGSAGAGGAAQQYLTGTAQGDYLGGSPYLNDILARSNREMADYTDRMFASGGRYGSGTHQGVMADSIGANTSNLLNANYQQERDRQMGAANALEASQQGRLGIQSGAAQGIAGIQGQNIANDMTVQGQNVANSMAAQGQNVANQMTAQDRNIQNNLAVQGQNVANSMTAQGQNAANQMSAANALGGLGQNQFGNQMQSMLGAAGLENQGFQNILGMISQLPTIQGNKVFDAQQQMGVGGQLDQASQQQLNDLINQWSQGDMQDWARLGGLLTAGTQSAGNWGTQTGTTSQPMNVLGALGGLMSLFSDRRLKTDIARIGTLDNGLPWYEYRYVWDAPDGDMRQGVMADEVEVLIPQAVHIDESGYAMVDYAQVLA